MDYENTSSIDADSIRTRRRERLVRERDELREEIATRARLDGATTPHQRTPPTGNVRGIKPKPYNNDSLQALREYLRRCETAFRLEPGVYSDDVRKVLYASQFLTGETAATWLRLEKQNGEDNTSWKEYSTFLRDLQQDPVTRAMTLACEYNEARQRPGQTVVQFVNYMDQLEAELPPYTDAQRALHLYAKLLPEIQPIMNNYQELPKTRANMIKLAIQIEGNLPTRARPTGAPHKTTEQSDGEE